MFVAANPRPPGSVLDLDAPDPLTFGFTDATSNANSLFKGIDVWAIVRVETTSNAVSIVTIVMRCIRSILSNEQY